MFQNKIKTKPTPKTTATIQQPQKQEHWDGSPFSKNGPLFLIPGFFLNMIFWFGVFFLFVAYRRGWLGGIARIIKNIFGFGSRAISSSIEKGSAHFAERREIKDYLTPMTANHEAGTLLIGKYKEKSIARLTHKFFVLPRKLATRHTLIAAPSGAGKSRSLFLPNLSITQKVSFIATDPKSELFNLTSAAQLNPIRFAPSDPDRSHCFNWIPLCKDIRTAKRCAEAISTAQETGKGDPIWTNNEKSLLTAIFIHTAHSQTPTPTHAYEILTSGTDTTFRELLNSPSPEARRAAKTIGSADAEKLRASAVIGLVGKLQWLDDPAIRRFTSSTIKPFDFRKLRHEPTQIYFCLKQSDVTELQPLIALFFNLAILQLIDEQGDIPINFYFDEFANIGKLNNFEKDITLLRGQDIAVIAGLQSKSQLSAIYGSDNANTIIENFNNKIILAGLQSDTAKDFAEMLGKYTFEDIRTSHGTSSSAGSFFNSHSSNESYYTSERALLTADELRRLPENDLILISTNIAPTYLQKNFFTGDKHNAAQIKSCSAEIATPEYKAIVGATFGKKKSLPSFEEFEDFKISDLEDIESHN